jgi:hypothetical protein
MTRTQPPPLRIVAARLEVPDWHELSAALCGHCSGRLDGCMVTRHAAMLANLHRIRAAEPERAEVIDRRRADLIILTDTWLANRLARRPKGRARSLGAAMDKIAAAQVAAEAAHRSIVPGEDNEQALQVWRHLAALLARWDLFLSYVFDGEALPWPADLPELEL